MRAWVALAAAGKAADRLQRRHRRALPAGRRQAARLVDLAGGADALRRVLTEGRPAMVTRIGSSELMVLRRHRIAPVFGPGIRRNVREQSGVFPTDRRTLAAFARRYEADAREADVVAAWFNWGEATFLERTSPDATLVRLRTLDPLPVPGIEPWTTALRGRRVLVVHPFTETIERQYRRRHLVADDDLLPAFELTTIRAVQSSGGATSLHRDWFEALAAMEEQLVASPAEVVLIGAGAYGLPLAATAKRAGKVALHLGGPLQLLFGIAGRRWDDRPDVRALATPSWVRPAPSERPPHADRIEGGAYW